MAEPTLVNGPVLVAAVDPWARRVAAMISRSVVTVQVVPGLDSSDSCSRASWPQASKAPRLAVLVVSGPRPAERSDHNHAERSDHNAKEPGADDVAARIAAARVALEAGDVTHLTVELDGGSIWVGPTVVPRRPGCDGCWQARRRQHGELLSAGLALGAAGSPSETQLAVTHDADSVRRGARAALAVMHRVLLSPDDEAGVVRRFTPDGARPSIGRVVAVSGCDRCDRGMRPTRVWSLHTHRLADLAINEIREEVKT